MITVTNSAAERMKVFLLERKKGVGIRLATKPSGCSGLAYAIEFCDMIQSDDTTFETNGVTIVVDAKSLPYLDGCGIDYLKKGLNEGFEFVNPNALSECGCGKSFSV